MSGSKDGESRGPPKEVSSCQTEEGEGQDHRMSETPWLHSWANQLPPGS